MTAPVGARAAERLAAKMISMVQKDPLEEALRVLPVVEPEPTPGEEWATLRDVLGLDVMDGKLLIVAMRRVPHVTPEGQATTKMFVDQAIEDPSWDVIERLAQDPQLDVQFKLSRLPADWVGASRAAHGANDEMLPRRIIGVDVDLAFGSHAEGGIDPAAATRALMTFPVKPAAVVSTGGGLHVYYHTDTDLGRTSIKHWAERINGWFARATTPNDPDRWDCQPTGKMSSTLRVPGTYNAKYADRPGGMPVRLVYSNPDAEALSLEDVEAMPTFNEVKNPPSRRAARPSVRTDWGDQVAPWDAFNAWMSEDEETFLAFLETLGAEVQGGAVCMPGDPSWDEPNNEFHSSVSTNPTTGTIEVTIWGSGTASYWDHRGEGFTQFEPYELLKRAFAGDNRAVARYYHQHIKPDPAAWLNNFRWRPGQPAPSGPPVETRLPAPATPTPVPPVYVPPVASTLAPDQVLGPEHAPAPASPVARGVAECGCYVPVPCPPGECKDF